MKKLYLLLLAFSILSACGSLNKTDDSNKIQLQIIKDKGVLKKGDWVTFYIEIINNSNEDISILKPVSIFGDQFDLFRVSTSECKDQPIVETTLPHSLLRMENDVTIIKAKSKKEFMIKGTLYNVICDSSPILVQVQYDALTFPEKKLNLLNENQKEQALRLLNRLTKIKLESQPVWLELK